MHYLAIDLETGGFDKEKDTITEAYFAIISEDRVLLEDLHLFMKNDDGEINGNQEAFDITGCDPETQLADPDTVTYTEGRTMLQAMLTRHKIPKKRLHYRFLGQNIVYFDIPFMDKQGFFTEEQVKKAGIGHNSLDTTLIVTWLKEIGILPTSVGSIESLIEYFGLQKGVLHTAKADTHMQKDIYFRLCDLMRQATMANLGGGATDSDLLKIVEL